VARATARIAIKRECTHPFGNKFNHLRGSSEDGPGVDSKMHELKAVGDILGQDPKSHLLALLHPDLSRAPAAALNGKLTFILRGGEGACSD